MDGEKCKTLVFVFADVDWCVYANKNSRIFAPNGAIWSFHNQISIHFLTVSANLTFSEIKIKMRDISAKMQECGKKSEMQDIPHIFYIYVKLATAASTHRMLIINALLRQVLDMETGVVCKLVLVCFVCRTLCVVLPATNTNKKMASNRYIASQRGSTPLIQSDRNPGGK